MGEEGSCGWVSLDCCSRVCVYVCMCVCVRGVTVGVCGCDCVGEEGSVWVEQP